MVMAVQLLRLWSMGVEIAQNNSAFQLQFAGIFTPLWLNQPREKHRHHSVRLRRGQAQKFGEERDGRVSSI